VQKSSPGGTVNYLYDGMNVLEDVDSSGNVIARYTQQPGIDQPLAQLRSGTTSYYQQDGVGSVTSLTNSAGTIANTYTYDSYGKLSASTGTLTNRFQYTGREFDSETGQYFYRARYFDQNVGRFLSEDPIRFRGGGSNFYSYVGNSPTNLIDPFGLTTCVVTPTLGTICYDWKPGMNWIEPQGLQVPPLPPDLRPNPPKPPKPPAKQCSCDNYMQREFEEIDRRSWHAVMKTIGISSATQAAEHWGPHWLEHYLPWVEGADLLFLEYELWEIQEDVSAKYKHCEQ
jgi:RHS repeat-associated protein